jgi:hypothetical protein
MPIPTSQREFERESRRLVDAEGISELADASVLLFPLGVISTHGRWVHGTAASPPTAEGPFEASQRGTTADPMITGFWRRSQDAAATPYSEEGAVDYPMAYHLASTLGGNCPRVGRRRHGDEDDAGRVQAVCAAEERRCAAPANGPFPPLQGISKDLGFDGPR